MALEQARHGEDVPDVVVHDEDPAAAERVVGIVPPPEDRALLLRKRGGDAMEEDRRLVEQLLERARLRDVRRFGQAPEPLRLRRGQLRGPVDDDREPGSRWLLQESL